VLPESGDYEVRAYFDNPYSLGGLSSPGKAVHFGYKIYRNGQFLYSLDGGPEMLPSGLPNLQDGKLVFGRDSITVNNESDLSELVLRAPQGVTTRDFAQSLLDASFSYDDSAPYRLPPTRYTRSISPRGRVPIGIHSRLAAGDYNSGSFAAGILIRTGGGDNIQLIELYLAAQGYVATGIENPVPQHYFQDSRKKYGR
jgi:hypothetical protein